jgi:hypothetical protein
MRCSGGLSEHPVRVDLEQSHCVSGIGPRTPDTVCREIQGLLAVILGLLSNEPAAAFRGLANAGGLLVTITVHMQNRPDS